MYATKTNLRTALGFKLDADVFQAYEKRQIALKMQDTVQIEMDQKLIMIKKQLDKMASKESVLCMVADLSKLVKENEQMCLRLQCN